MLAFSVTYDSLSTSTFCHLYRTFSSAELHLAIMIDYYSYRCDKYLN